METQNTSGDSNFFPSSLTPRVTFSLFVTLLSFSFLCHQVFRDRKWLGSISYAQGHMTYPSSSLNAEVPSSFTVRNMFSPVVDF